MENINVLIVEGKKSVAEHLERRLKELEYSVCAIVPTGAEAVEKAAEMQPDVVLINIELEGEIDGIEAAKRIRDSLDIPTIYLADYSNDAFSKKKDLLKRAEITNPFDYIPQPHGRRRLYLTVESTVYQHKMERETKAKEQQLSTILNSISDAVIATDNKELVTFMNPAAERLTGWVLEQAASVNIKQIFQIDTEGDCPITAVLRNMLDTNTAVSPESPADAGVKDSTVFTSKSGRKTHIDYSIAPSINQKGKVTGTVITFRDITDYKALEERLNQTINEARNQSQLMETVFNSMHDGVIVLDSTGQPLFVNPSLGRICGPEPRDVDRSEWSEAYGIFYPDKKTCVPTDQMPITRALQGKEISDEEFFVRNEHLTDGLYVMSSAFPLFDENQQTIGSVGIVRDITKEKAAAAELKQTLTKLQNQTQLMETIFNSISDGVMAVDTDGQYLMVNARAQELVGPLSEDISIADRPKRYGLFHPDGKTLFSGDELPIKRALRGETTDNIEMLVSNDTQAEEIFVNINGRPLLDGQGNLKGGVIVFHDITKLKATQTKLEQTFNELRDKTQLMETVFDSMAEGIAVISVTGQVMFVNPSIKQMLGTRPLDTSASNWSETYGVFYPDKERYIPIDQFLSTHIFRGEAIRDREIFVRNEGQTDGINVMVSGLPLFDENRGVIGCVAILRDITESKVAEAQLEQAMQELQNQVQLTETVFNSISDGVVVTDESGNFLLVNPSATRIIGMGATDTPPDQWSDTYGTFYPDKVTPFPNEELPLIQAMQGRVTDEVDLFIRNPENPEGCFINVTGRPLQDERNSVRGGVIVFRDVTKAKGTEARLEQTVRELEDQTQLMDIIFNNMSDGVVVADDNGQYIMSNPAAQQMIGEHLEELDLPRASEQYGVFHPTTDSLFPADQLPLARAVGGESTNNVEMRIDNEKLLQEVYVSVNGRPLLDEKGVSRGGVVVARDITKIKQTQIQLESQTQLLETVFSNMSDGVLVAAENGEYIMANPAAEQMIGGQQFDELDLPQSSEQYGLFDPTTGSLFSPDQLPLTRAVKGESTDNIEMHIKNPQLSQEVYVSVNGRPLLDEKGIARGGVVVAHNITELKQTQIQLEQTIAELENQGQLLEVVFNNMSDGVVVADDQGRYVMYNQTAEQMTNQQLDPMDIQDAPERFGFFFPDEKTTFPADQLPLARALHGEESNNTNIFMHNSKMPEGLHLSISARPLRNAQGVVTGGVSVSRDVTKLRQAEIELKSMVTQLEDQGNLMESIFNSISDGVVVADENGAFTIFNPSAEKIVGMGAVDTTSDHWSDTYGLFFPDRVTPFPSEELPLTLALKGEASDEVEMFVRNPNVPDGVFISVSGRPLHDEAGIYKGGVAVFRDVTHRVIAEEALMQAFAQGRLEIVETILHNIGNAINSVTVGINVLQENLVGNQLVNRFSGLADMVKAHQEDWVDFIKNDPRGQQVLPFVIALAADFTNQNERVVETLERVGERVTHIIDIIRTQRSSNQSSMTRKTIDLQQAIWSAVKLQQDSIDKRGIQVDVHCENAPQEIQIQESQFQQMLVNLLKNSVEAIDELIQSDGLNETPRIEIKTYIGEDFLCLDVTDNGIGIEQKNSKLIFNAGYTTKESGTGLGLHSAANFVIGSGGQIHLVSEGIGKGATMRIMLRCSSVMP